ncbi:hypothetical protein, partial [Pseudomonas viridiflava]
IKSSFDFLEKLSPEDFGKLVERFDIAFKSIDAAKVNLGKYRRELSRKLIEKSRDLISLNEIELLTYFSDETAG